jgi:hypothetical protein
MTFFQIDWITIDIMTIILLLLLLIGVRVIKTTYRWRSSISNEVLENILFLPSRKWRKNQFILSKKWSLTRNKTIKESHNKSPIILIIRTKNTSKLLKFLTEGLSSYGFDVINLKIKIKYNPETETLENSFVDEWKSLLSDIFEKLKKREIKSKLHYIIIDCSKKFIRYKYFLPNLGTKGIIIINPKIGDRLSSETHEYFKTTFTKVNTIFSRKSILFFKNKHLKKFLVKFAPQKNILSNCISIENANNSFKYYETILLGIIIDIIENKLIKS